MSVSMLMRAAVVVALFGVVSRFLGLGREMVLAAVYGNSGSADAFVNALNIVNVISAILLYVMVTVVIPAFTAEQERGGEASAWSLAWAITGWMSLFVIAMATVIAVFPEAPAALFRLDPERAAITRDLIRIMAPALLFQGISAMFTALLQIHGKFGVPAAVGTAFNLGIIAGVVAGQQHLGIEAAAWGVSAGALFQVLLQLPQFLRVARAEGTRPRMTHPRLGAIALSAAPIVGASAMQQLNSFTDRFFASSLEPGRVAALSYANSLGAAPRAALLIPLMTPLFPFVARVVAQGRDREAVRGISRVAGLLALVAVPASLLLAVYARETTQLLLGRGKCDAGCVTETTGPMVFYALALLGNFLSVFFNRTMAAAQLQSAILVATSTTVVITIVFDIILLGPMEQSGLAAASAVGVYCQLLMYVFVLRRRFPDLDVRRLGHRQAVLLGAGGAIIAVAFAMDRVLPTDDLKGWSLVGPLGAKVALALLAYLAVVRIVARPELTEATGAIRSVVRRKPTSAAG
ncbi:MAG: hypothetical protein H6531_07290 [Actinobacteria bacterium]|nr:hypothetical protein [Actinomycetota bacterium]